MADHVLSSCTTPTAREAADAALAPLVTAELLERVLALVPGDWLQPEPAVGDVRAAYRDHLLRRVADRGAWRP